MTEKIELPPLPPPGVFDMSGKFGLGWTAEQMRSFASEVVRLAVEAERERCAAIADSLESAEEDGWSAAGSFIADAIRSTEA